MKKIKRIVITGGNGFVGSALCRELIKHNFHKILILCRHKDKHNPTPQFIIKKNVKPDNILQKDDVVIHLACTTVPALSQENLLKDIQENIFSTLSLLNACVKANVKQFIFMSSGGTVYGNTVNLPVKESHPTHPANAHGTMKLMIEKYIQLYSHLYGLRYVILRGGNFYGWQQLVRTNQGIIDVFLHKIRQSKNLEVWGDGTIVRDYIYIKDVTNFFITLLSSSVYDEIINVGTGKGTSVKEIIAVLKNITKENFHVLYRNQRNYDVQKNILDIQKAKTLLGWKPAFSVREGIRDLFYTLTHENLVHKL